MEINTNAASESPRRNSPNDVVTGTLPGVTAAVREAIGNRWREGPARKYVAVMIRTRGGLVIRVFPDFKGRKPQPQGE